MSELQLLVGALELIPFLESVLKVRLQRNVRLLVFVQSGLQLVVFRAQAMQGRLVV